MNVFYAVKTPYGTVRLKLLMDHTHYRSDAIKEINPLSVWSSFDKRRQSPLADDIPNPPFRRYIELSWEFQPGMSLERARTLLTKLQKAEEITVDEVLRRKQEDPDYQQAYREIA